MSETEKHLNGGTWGSSSQICVTLVWNIKSWAQTV